MRAEVYDELARVESSLVTMARVARETMRLASTALLTPDHGLAQDVAERTDEIGVLYRVVEDRVYDLVERQHPAEHELRMIMTALRIAADLERMGDLAAHVAKASLRRQPRPAVGAELAGLFRSMSTVADELAGKIVSALADQDAALAAQLDGDDDAMDDLHTELFSVMLRPDWPLGVEAAVDGALLGRFYERYADNAVNVGRHIVFLVSGKQADA